MFRTNDKVTGGEYRTDEIMLIFRCGCEEGCTTEWNPEGLVSRGTPVCYKSGEEMEYVGWIHQTD